MEAFHETRCRRCGKKYMRPAELEQIRCPHCDDDPRFFIASEFKVTCLRECPTPAALKVCDTPEAAAEYWRLNICTHPYYSPEVETFFVLLLTTRRHVKGHVLVSHGTLDTILVHPREVFRAAIISASAAVIIMHVHPSGDPTPSESDIKITRELIRAGQLLKLDLLDHIIMGQASPERPKDHVSLRELGYFYQ